MNRFIDFDAAMAEAEDRPLVVRCLGRDWDLYSAIPAKPVFQLLRMQADGRSEDELGQSEMVNFMSELVPPDTFDAWLDGGLTIDQIAKLLRAVLTAYQGTEPGEALGEASGPKPGPASSSNIGPRSKRTSSASTASKPRKR